MRVEPFSSSPNPDLSPVLEEEIGCWQHELDWNYRPAAQVIKKYLKARSLTGYVLTAPSGRAVGYTYYVLNSSVGYIGNIFVSRSYADLQAYHKLLTPTLTSLRRNKPLLRRIECQIFPFNCDLAPLFRRHRFEMLDRLFLHRDLGSPEPIGAPPTGFEVTQWKPRFFVTAASVILDSYRNSQDFQICQDYQSLQGCTRFLRNLIDSPGCGEFQSRTSLMAFDNSGSLVGILLSTRIGPQMGMIPQISIRRNAQGRGLGTFLLKRYFALAAGQSIERTALSVTETNHGAYKLYRRLGFRLCKSFKAFFWNGPNSL